MTPVHLVICVIWNAMSEAGLEGGRVLPYMLKTLFIYVQNEDD